MTLVLLGGIGLVGGLAAWDAWQRSRTEPDNSAQPQPAPPPISAGQTYDNNTHLPGAGYYHAPYHAWFPFPFNYHDPARGYYAGGLWNTVPLVLALSRSQPSPAAVMAANTALLARREQEEAIYRNNRGAGGSGFRSGWGRGSGSSPGSSGSSVRRGGFGSSGHGFLGGGG